MDSKNSNVYLIYYVMLYIEIFYAIFSYLNRYTFFRKTMVDFSKIVRVLAIFLGF